MTDDIDPEQLDDMDVVGEPDYEVPLRRLVYRFPDGEQAMFKPDELQHWELRNSRKMERHDFKTFDELIAFRRARRAQTPPQEKPIDQDQT